MASVEEPTSHTEDGVNPTTAMLPPFRVRKIREDEGDGVVRMKRTEYDELLKRQPTAALMYVDESDGEVVLVGSAFELDQRLQEPIVQLSPTAKTATAAAAATDDPFVSKRPMHAFDVEKEQTVIRTWQELDERTAEEGAKAKGILCTINGLPIAKGKGKAKDVLFGQVSPPRSQWQNFKSSLPQRDEHANRWASYSSLPGSLDKEPVAVSTADDKSKSEGASPPSFSKEVDAKPVESQSEKADASVPRSAFDVMIDPNAAPPVRSSTVQIPATQKQKNEYQLLLDMFLSERKKKQPDNSKTEVKESTEAADDKKEWQPLLDMFENKLAALGETSAEDSVSSAVPGAAEPKAESSEPTHPGDPVVLKPGEILAQSIQSLLNGMGALANVFKQTNSELQQQIALAQQDFPNNVEKAVKSSVAALEMLKGVIPVIKVADHNPTEESKTTSENSQPKEINATDETKDAISEERVATDPLPVTAPSTEDALWRKEKEIFYLRHKIQRALIPKGKPTTCYVTLDKATLLEIDKWFQKLESYPEMEQGIARRTKIPKLMSAIAKMDNVPGDKEFLFTSRATSLLGLWPSHKESKSEKAQEAVPQSSEEANQDKSLTELPVTQPTQPPAAPADSKSLKIDTAEVASAQSDTDQHARVEEAVEDMRRHLLRMGWRGPDKDKAGSDISSPGRSVYTRADIIEAYVEKFKALEQLHERLVGEKMSTPSQKDAIGAVPYYGYASPFFDFHHPTSEAEQRASVPETAFAERPVSNENRTSSLLDAGPPGSSVPIPVASVDTARTATPPPPLPARTSTDLKAHDEKLQRKSSMASNIWAVEKIVGRRWITYGTLDGFRVTQYLVRWVGAAPSEDMWYDAGNLKDCMALISAFENTTAPEMSSMNAADLHHRTAGDSMVTSPSIKDTDSFGAATKVNTKAPLVDFVGRSEGSMPYTQTQSKAPNPCQTCLDRQKTCDRAAPECNNCINGSFFCKPLSGPTSRDGEPIMPFSDHFPLLGPIPPAFTGFPGPTHESGRLQQPQSWQPRPVPSGYPAWMVPSDKPSKSLFDPQNGFSTVQSIPSQQHDPVQQHVARGSSQKSVKLEDAPKPGKFGGATVRSQPHEFQAQGAKIRNRQSWHPDSDRSGSQQQSSLLEPLSPTVAMQKYPPISIDPSPPTRKARPPVTEPKVEKGHPTLWQSSSFFDNIDRNPKAPATNRLSHQKSMPALRGAAWTAKPVEMSEISRAELPSHSASTRAHRPDEIPPQSDMGPSRSASTRTFDERKNFRRQRRLDRQERSFDRGTRVAEPSQPAQQPKEQNEVLKCVQKLLEMGYQRDQAETVATAAEGKLETAIDILDEDQIATKEAHNARRPERRDPVPGSWDHELYG